MAHRPLRDLVALALTLAACAPTSGPVTSSIAEPIRPSAEYPGFWEYGGEPVMLLGGSREDNLFQVPDVEEHLDLLASVGGNYIRNTMSSRDSAEVWPFARRDDGLYDLDRLSDEYFERFERLVRLAAERGIIVQIELWDRFDFAREPWLANPYRPANNVNYTPEESGLANEYPRHPGQNDNPFFRSIPAHDDNASLLRYQHAQVDRLLEISLKYSNVLYTMDNETSATQEWGAYWSRYLERKAAEAGVEVFTTEMWDAWDLTDEEHRRTLDHPELYAFADISQNNHNTGQQHWDNLQWVREYTAERPRPLNHVKIYGADTGRYGTDRDAVERFWRSLIGGAASVRFHRPPSGIGAERAGAGEHPQWAAPARGIRPLPRHAGRGEHPAQRSASERSLSLLCPRRAVRPVLRGRGRRRAGSRGDCRRVPGSLVGCAGEPVAGGGCGEGRWRRPAPRAGEGALGGAPHAPIARTRCGRRTRRSARP